MWRGGGWFMFYLHYIKTKAALFASVYGSATLKAIAIDATRIHKIDRFKEGQIVLIFNYLSALNHA